MRRAAWPAIALPVAALLVAACFSERTGGPLVSSGDCRIPVTVIDSQDVVIAIKDFLFQPDSIVVPTGGRVTWIDCEDPLVEPHTTTSDAPAWDSGNLGAGGRYTRTFPAQGTFPYHCAIHPYMLGKVVVQ
jgi:plastocyanin